MLLRQDELDALWDFEDASATEARLRTAAEAETDPERREELRTQVARALGLQGRFADADALLDTVEPLGAAVRTRRALERGRVRNSSGDPTAAIPSFADAASTAEHAGLTFLYVDALHMLGIADAANVEIWTARALAVLDGSADPRVLRWCVSLHNNLGWARLDAGDLAAALEEFEAALDAAERYGTTQQVRWAREAIDECRAAISAKAAREPA